MHDFIIEHLSVCPTVHHFHKHVKGSTGEYDVTYGPTPDGDYTHGWTCTCPSARYRKGECKHIKAVKGERCAWNEEAFCGSGAPRPADGKCPQCGADLEVIRVAV